MLLLLLLPLLFLPVVICILAFMVSIKDVNVDDDDDGNNDVMGGG